MTLQGNIIRVLVIDDSVVYRTLIQTSLSSNPDIEVVGIANNAFDAKEKIAQLKPDVLTLDVEMPGMSGIELTKKLMETYPIPIILVSATNINVFDALQAGAIDFVKKPDANRSVSPEAFINGLIAKIKVASIAKISKQETLSATIAPKITTNASSNTNDSVHDILDQRFKNCTDNVCNSTIVALGASTGGTEATLEVLKRLPARIPPIVIVQHMPAGFTKLYAERLDKICAMKVKEAVDGDIIVPGQVYIAPGNYQMRLVKTGHLYKLNCKGNEKFSGHCPSVDVLFDSVSKESLNNNVGIIMTGMGKDGAAGLLEMRKKGAYTIGESQESCVVYGMPMVAQNIGAVMDQASAKNIPNLLIKYLNTLG